MKTKAITVLCAFLLVAGFLPCWPAEQKRAQAQPENLRMQFDFTDVQGTSVKDGTSGIVARLMSTAKVEPMGQYHVLNLGNGTGYLDLTAAAGTLLAGMDDHTISAYYRVDEAASLSGNGYFLWAFSTSSACTATGGVYSAYRLNAQRIASSTGGYQNETGYSVGTASAQGRWVHVAFTQTGTTGRLYIDGVLKGTVTSMPTNSTLYDTTKPSFCWVGRAPFTGDSYLKQTLVADLRLYDRALTLAEVKALAAETSMLDYAYQHGTKGDATALLAAISEAEGYVTNADHYLPGAIADLRDLVAMGRQVAEGQFSQSYIDALTEQITATIQTVKRTAGLVLPPAGELAGSYDTDRGFLHPGGLHSQQDFDRIKQQLFDGNALVTQAYNKLRGAAYAQSSAATYPVETIVRGGGVGENYINAARGAAIAYQNALRWKIEGTVACARHAVDVLMQWARTTKAIGGDSNYALAAGLYGYQFAQAAELVRDYEGWSADDFATFKQWMLSVWYPSAIGFLRGRNGTWENADHWWQAPGHYWSNWGLCNALCVSIIGILCDDVFIYNQGMSYFKYDQVGTYKHPRTDNPIRNDGLTEFLGNLVVTTTESPLETGAYGQLGQMNESGRDTGHSAMALGLAVDLAKVGWNQGDDLFAYMDHRLAAGIEYVAAQTQSVEGLPWVNYQYGTNGLYYTDSRVWTMTGPALGAQMRPYWGTVIGIYEGVKGVQMPFSEVSYQNMGIDEGGQGGTSGGYDHLGYSVLMNTRDVQLCPSAEVPTELSGKMLYSGTLTANLIPSLSVERTLGNISGQTISHNELGGLVNTFQPNNKTCVPRGETLTLMPQLPADEEDTGLWQWNTGQTTRNITIVTDRSFVYRVTYTNSRGAESQLCFAIAVENDCVPTSLTGQTASTLSVVYGQRAVLGATPACGWGTWQWSTGQTTQTITTAPIVAPRDYTVYYTNQGSALSAHTFHVDVVSAQPYITVGTKTTQATEVIVAAGQEVTLGLLLPDVVAPTDVLWSDGSCGMTHTLTDPQSSTALSATFTLQGESHIFHYQVFVKDAEASRFIEPGNYLLRHVATDTYLTANGENQLATFTPLIVSSSPLTPQVWFVDRKTTAKYNFIAVATDSLRLTASARTDTWAYYPFSLQGAQGTDRYALYTTSTTTGNSYWDADAQGNVLTTAGKTLTAFPFELIPAPGGADGVASVRPQPSAQPCYDLQGRRLTATPQHGVYIVGGKKHVR